MLIPIIMFYMTNTMLNYFADEGAFGNQKTFTYLGFDWVNLLHSSLCGAVFHICDQNNLDT